MATFFGIRGGEAQLHAFRFCPARFSPNEALRWLAEGGLVAAFFIESTGPAGC